MINDRSTRFQTGFEEAEQDTFRDRSIQPPTEEESEGVTPSRAILDAVETGVIDLGDEGKGITPQQAMNRATVRQAANQFLPEFVEQKRAEYSEVAKNMATMPRLLSAGNNFYRSLSKYLGEGAFKTQAVFKAALHNMVVDPENQISASQLPEYLAADQIGRNLEEIFPTSVAYREEFWAGTMAQAAGSLAPNVVVGVATAGMGTWATVGTSALVNASVSGEFYDEAIAEGASEDEAFQFTLLNMAGTAALESIPTALFASRINKATGGGLKDVIKKGFKGSIEEGTTEAVQQTLANVSAIGIFDSTREILDGVYESFAAGALLGAAVNMTLPTLMKRVEQAETASEMAEASVALEYAAEMSEIAPGRGTSRAEITDFINRRVPEKGIPEVKDGVVETSKGAALANTLLDTKSAAYKASKKKWKKFWDKYLRSGGIVGPEIKEREGQLDARISRQIEEAHINFSRLNRAVLDEYGSKKKSLYEAIEDSDDPVPVDIMNRVDKVLRGEAEPSSLPQTIQEPVKRARAHIDRLSVEFIKEGLVQGDQVVSFGKNFGSYIHRSYKRYDQNVEWGKEQIPDDVWNAAVAYIRNTEINRFFQETGENPSGKKLKQLQKRAEIEVGKIIRNPDKNSLQSLFNKRPIVNNKADRSVLMEKTDVPKPIRDLLGEYTDPAVNYINTISQMSQLVERRRYFDQIAEMGKGHLFITEAQLYDPDFDGNPDNYVAGLADNTGSKLSSNPSVPPGKKKKPPQLYMHKDVHEALSFVSDNSDRPMWATMFLRLTSAAKISKTALSHVTHARNLAGGMAFLNSNGLYFTGAKEIKDTWRSATTVFKSYEKLSKQEIEDKWLKYVELDLTGDSVRGDEILELMKDLNYSPESFLDSFTSIKNRAKNEGIFNAFKNIFGKGTRKLIDIYRMEDTLMRVWAFELESARMKRADPSITDQEVANMVNNTYPNYSRVNEAIAELRINPIISPFISFPAEFVRTQFNTMKYAIEQRKSDNPAIRKIGSKRLAGTIMNYTGVVGAGIASKALLRMGDEEEDAYRQFMPPWDANSVVVYTDASRGVVRYVNTSYTMPNAYLLDPAMAMVRGDSDRDVLERFTAGMAELFGPILNQELVFQMSTEILSNKKASGGEIWNPEDTTADKMQKGLLHFWTAVEPGSISSFQRLAEPFTDQTSDARVSDELMGFFGMRISSLDIERSYGFRVRELRKNIRNSRRVYNSVKFREGASSSEVSDAFRRSNESYAKNFQDLRTITDAAQQTGVQWNELEQIMEDSGLSQRDITSVRTGVFQPFDR